MPVSASNLKPLCLATLLLLPGCAVIDDAYSTSGSGALPGILDQIGGDSEEQKQAKAMNLRMMSVDQAADRVRARNELIIDLLTESDTACSKRLTEMAADAEHWPVSKSEKKDQLSLTLESGIAQRKYDKSNADMRIALPETTGSAAETLVRTIGEQIDKQRQQTRTEIEARLQMDIHRYTLKQALEDVQTYHESCSIEQGAAAVARATERRMSAEERQAELESLFKLRQTLMEQGLSTRAVQKKIDAVIMAE